EPHCRPRFAERARPVQTAKTARCAEKRSALAVDPEHAELEQVACERDRLVAELPRLATVEPEAPGDRLDRLGETQTPVERQYELGLTLVQLRLRPRPFREHEPGLLHVAVPIELLLEAGLRHQRGARRQHRVVSTIPHERQGAEDALDLVPGELE